MKLHRIHALLIKYFYISSSIERMADIFFWPLVDVFVWGFLSYYLSNVIGKEIAFTFLLGVCFRPFELRGVQDLPVFILEDYWSRNLYNVFSSPLRISELLTTISIISFIRSLISFCFISFITIWVYDFNPIKMNISMLLISVLILSVFGWSIGMMVSSLIIRYGQRIQFLVWSAFWVLQPFSCTFYPLKTLPPWAQKIAQYLPTTYVYEGFRSISPGISWEGIKYAILASFVCLAIGGYLFVRSFKYARKNALLARSD